MSKRTETDRFRSMVRVHVGFVPRAAQSPPQPRKSRPWSTAVSVIRVPGLKVAVQVPGQLMPPLPVTLPLVGGITVSATVGDPKVADTVRLAVIVTVQGVPAAVPPQAPPQLSWTLGAVGWAVRVTRWPGSNVAVHVPGQLMPFGPVMVPLTGRWTVSTGRVTGRVTTRMVTEVVAVRLPGKVAWTLTW